MNNNDIFVYIELDKDGIKTSSLELIAKAQELKEKNKGKVVAILLETPQQDFAQELIYYGADRVLNVKNDLFENYDPIVYKDAIVLLAKKYDPSIFLLSATFLGRSLAPRVQGALETGLTADVLDLDINQDNKLVQIKPSYGDNLMSTIILPHARPQMTTVRPQVFKALKKDTTRTGEIIQEEILLSKNHIFEVIESKEIEKTNDNLTSAQNVVAIGRGIKSSDDLALVEDLTQNLNAQLGVTRPLAENGWYTIEKQIGQSGETISPDFILNLGISGAVQYTVGMKNAGLSISVNKDKDASIFKESDYAYVGDAKAFINELNQLLK